MYKFSPGVGGGLGANMVKALRFNGRALGRGILFSRVFFFFSSLNFRDLHMLIGTANKSHIRETDNGYLRNL